MAERGAAYPELLAFDQLASMVAVVAAQLADAALAELPGHCLWVNSACENSIGLSRRALQRSSVFDWLVDPAPLRDTLLMVARNDVASGRFDALLKRQPVGAPELPVHVIISLMDGGQRVLIEMIEIEQQTRLDREERTHSLAQANKELVRNLAHEIKNPLGGIRGAAQLVAMEVGRLPGTRKDDRLPRGTATVPGEQGALSPRELGEYAQIIIKEADRLQALVDRLLAPHRRPQVVADVNIHEVCERVRSLLLAEFPRGLQVARDYDVSIPEFRGDREQLIQAVLNIAHNATQALAERIADGDAQLMLRTRVARQATFGRQRFRLALELHIEDNGPGVPEAIRERIFHPLVSGRDGGSGLGLTLAQTFVQQHHGAIECDSVPGRTLFKILIPLP
jgi:two-component system, NtrC family, nitrogen regulation sensor histidine kinase GlnL